MLGAWLHEPSPPPKKNPLPPPPWDAWARQAPTMDQWPCAEPVAKAHTKTPTIPTKKKPSLPTSQPTSHGWLVRLVRLARLARLARHRHTNSGAPPPTAAAPRGPAVACGRRAPSWATGSAPPPQPARPGPARCTGAHASESDGASPALRASPVPFQSTWLGMLLVCCTVRTYMRSRTPGYHLCVCPAKSPPLSDILCSFCRFGYSEIHRDLVTWVSADKILSVGARGFTVLPIHWSHLRTVRPPGLTWFTACFAEFACLSPPLPLHMSHSKERPGHGKRQGWPLGLATLAEIMNRPSE